MEKTVTILRIILLALLITILCFALTFFIKKDYNFNFDINGKAPLVYDQDIKEPFDNIIINSDSLDIRFVKSDDEKVNIKIYDYEDNITLVSVQDKTLTINSDNKVQCYFCFMKRREAVITLPEKVYDLTVETKSGDIASDINFNKVNIVSNSGDLAFLSINEAIIELTSGDLAIKEVGSLQINSTSGDIDIEKVNNHLEIHSNSGDIDIKKLSITKDSSITVISGDVNVLNASDDIYFNAKSTSGDVIINNNNRYAAYELNIKTTSGDVLIKN